MAITRGKKEAYTWASNSRVALKRRSSEFMWYVFLGQQEDSNLLETISMQGLGSRVILLCPYTALTWCVVCNA